MLNPFQMTYTAGQVAAAADVTDSTLQNWLKRGNVLGLDEIGGAGGKGRARAFSFHSVIEIATAAELVRQGMTDLSLAFNAGMGFAHTGDGQPGDANFRLPGVPYNSGVTLLAVAGQHSQAVQYRPGHDFFAFTRNNLGRPRGLMILDMNMLFERACIALDLQPHEVMQFAYGMPEAHG